ncbi:hypothetical protein B484DRAFT_395382 [Ochromonadaceae sp. CCMP2298]|nr:hypothetical protein B484DRAFT_395382 [Ochromonadaceae sp. CCMP2298]
MLSSTQRAHLLPPAAQIAQLPAVQRELLWPPSAAGAATLGSVVGEVSVDADGATLRADRETRETDNRECSAAVHACIFASALTKRAAERAFQQQGRAMTAPDVIEQLGRAFVDLHPEG